MRGLDYYSHTVWECVVDGSTVLAGGRYDDLSTILGFRATPSIGWAAGAERLLLALR